MTPLVRFLLQHALIGFGIAVPFVGLLLALDVGHLRRLVTEPEFNPGAVLLLVFFVGLTFGSLQMAMPSGRRARTARPSTRTKATTTGPGVGEARRSVHAALFGRQPRRCVAHQAAEGMPACMGQ